MVLIGMLFAFVTIGLLMDVLFEVVIIDVPAAFKIIGVLILDVLLLFEIIGVLISDALFVSKIIEASLMWMLFVVEIIDVWLLMCELMINLSVSTIIGILIADLIICVSIIDILLVFVIIGVLLEVLITGILMINELLVYEIGVSTIVLINSNGEIIWVSVLLVIVRLKQSCLPWKVGSSVWRSKCCQIS